MKFKTKNNEDEKKQIGNSHQNSKSNKFLNLNELQSQIAGKISPKGNSTHFSNKELNSKVRASSYLTKSSNNARK
jgi:hypothetical protein